MKRASLIGVIVLAAMAPLAAQDTGMPRDLIVAIGKSLVIDSPVEIQRVSVASPDVVEAVGVAPKEVLLNGKAPGQTSVIVWQQGGNRMFFDVTVRPTGETRLDAVRREMAREFEGQDVQLSMDKDTVFVRGTVRDLSSSERAVAIASSLGKPVNLLKVALPQAEPQILLKVKFADVDRGSLLDLGVNIISTGATNTIGSVSTGQFSPPRLAPNAGAGNTGAFVLSELLNIFLYRPDLNLAATIKALQERKLVQILAEPNLLTANGKAANFLAGGEFPYPVVQGTGGTFGAAVTIVFKEFGVRINFLPTITARGTIKLIVEPEVSALDYSNGLVYQGFNIPGLSTRRVSTEIELEDRQSFGIAGLLDNRLQETISKIPGLADIPILGKLFQSKSTSRNNTELLVMVTPEIVRPIPVGQPLPAIEFPKGFLKGGATSSTRTPAEEVTGGIVPAAPIPSVIPVEALVEERKQSEQNSAKRVSSMKDSTGYGAGTVKKSN